MDVVEIDAASHGGVDDARELREKAPTAPMVGREKVYIIDEAQRLSREAFDALLKLFEEPPPGVRFVLATTEPHKMPATIVGRCQRFDFRRLTIEGLSEHLQTIATSEGVDAGRRPPPTRSRAMPKARRATRSRCWTRQGCSAGRRSTRPRSGALLGAPRGEVQVEIADVVAVGDVRGVFEVGRSAGPGRPRRPQRDERDARALPRPVAREDRARPGRPPRHPGGRVRGPADPGREVHRRASSRGSSRCCSRRRTTCAGPRRRGSRWSSRWCGPRIPETDPSAGGTLARLERLERLANVDPATVVPRRRRRGRPGRGPNAGAEPGLAAAPVGDPTPAQRTVVDTFGPTGIRLPASRSPPRRPRRP